MAITDSGRLDPMKVNLLNNPMLLRLSYSLYFHRKNLMRAESGAYNEWCFDFFALKILDFQLAASTKYVKPHMAADGVLLLGVHEGLPEGESGWWRGHPRLLIYLRE
jgi:hypothetical protein